MYRALYCLPENLQAVLIIYNKTVLKIIHIAAGNNTARDHRVKIYK
jgi:hypothetical protein